MIEVTVQGVTVNVGQRDELLAIGYGVRDVLLLSPTSGLAITPAPDKMQMFQMLGRDCRKIDWSLPQPWVDEQERKHPGFDTRLWAWSYEDGSLFGEPIQASYWELEAAIVACMTQS